MSLSVTELNNNIKEILEGLFSANISVVGEVSNLKPSNRHMYFTLKDENSSISITLWNYARFKNISQLKDGQKIIVTGRISVYTKTGNYQLNTQYFELVGIGNLQKEYNLIKDKYESLGYFDPTTKKSLPKKIRKLGILTSADGAALQDVLYVLKKNNFIGTVYIKSCSVQGIDCSKTVATGLQILDNMNLDVIIITRGGGSFEDLFGFSHPLVLEAIHNTKTCTVSAIGHEVDNMLSDLVADIRTPTPSVSAEIITTNQKVEIENMLRINKIHENHINLIKKLSAISSHLESIQKSLISPIGILDRYNAKLDGILAHVYTKIKFNLSMALDNLDRTERKVQISNPSVIFDKGYIMIQDESGDNIDSVEEIRFIANFDKNKKLKLQFKDGYVFINPSAIIIE